MPQLTPLAAAAAPDATLAIRTILVVEDNPTVAESLATLLKRQGFSPTVFLNGRDALAYAAGTSDTLPPPAAALIDIHLQDMSGLVLSQQLRQHLGPQFPIIVVSGDTSMATLNSLPHVGATYFFPKPLQSSKLIARLKELVA